MKMKEIEWLGDERELPGYGHAVEGSRHAVPALMADSYVNQGLAKLVVNDEPAKLKDKLSVVNSKE